MRVRAGEVRCQSVEEAGEGMEEELEGGEGAGGQWATMCKWNGGWFIALEYRNQI